MDLAEKMYWILIEDAQHDLNRKLGEKIMMSPDEVRNIIKKHEEELSK